jgi:hypothetical protein
MISLEMLKHNFHFIFSCFTAINLLFLHRDYIKMFWEHMSDSADYNKSRAFYKIARVFFLVIGSKFMFVFVCVSLFMSFVLNVK